MKNALIIDGIRTPIGKFGGSLSAIRPDDMAAHVIKTLVQRHPSLSTSAIDDVILGCANQAGEDNRNIARMAALLAGFPVTVPGETVNRLCASGMSAVIHASNAIAAGNGNLFIAGGVEHMTRAPYVLSKSARPFGTDAKLEDSSFGWRFINPAMKAMYGTDPMGITAENLVDLYGISRNDQDLFAYQSQIKASKAQQNGRLAKEIIAMSIPQGKNSALFSDDEFIKPQTNLETLNNLKPAFKTGGTVTAGNASGLNDGAAALLIANRTTAQQKQLQPLATIISSAVVGVEPRIMGIGPVPAAKLALKRAGLELQDMDIIEINEAFAAQVLACTRALNIADDDARVNINGGAIALGHPLGMTGARILLSAAISLKELQKEYALVSMCIGVGQGYAVIIQNAG